MIEILITSSVLIVLLLAVRRTLRGRIPMTLQYGLWLLVALRLLIPGSLFSSPVSVLSGVEALRDQAAVSQVPPPAPDRGQGGQEWSGPAGPVSSVPGPQGDLTPTAPAPEGENPAPFPWGNLVRWVWWGGMALTAGWFLLANLSFRRQLLAGRKPVEGADSPIPVYLAPGAGSPCLYGLFRPAIYVTPACLEAGRLSHVVAHELTHRRHGDQLWSLVRCACLILYWFDPLVWVAAVCSRRDCELACDEGALRRLGEDQRLPYGRTLVAVAAQAARPGHLLRTATTMSSGARALLERVERIARRPRVTALAAACALTVSLLGACAAFSGAAPEESPAPSPSEDVQTVDAQEAWAEVKTALDGGEGLSDFSTTELAAAYPLSDGAYTQGIVSQLALSFPGVLEVGAGALEQEEWQSLWRGVVSELHALGSPYPQLIQAALDRGTDAAGQLSLLRAAEEAWQRDNGAADPTQAIYQMVEDGYASLLDPALDGRLTGDGDFLAVHVYVIGWESTGDFTSFYCWVYLWSCAPGETGGYLPLSALSNGVTVTLQSTAEGWVPAPLTPFEAVPDGMAAEDFFPEGLVLDNFSAYDYDGLLAAKAEAALALQAMA